MPIPFITQKKKTAEEIEQENEVLMKQNEQEQLQLSIAQQRAMRQKLEAQGLSLKKDFGGSLKRAWVYLNKKG